MSVRDYTLAADWSGDGTFTGTLEDVTSYALDDPVLRVGYGRDTAQATSPMAAGKLAFGLNNTGNEFGPESTTSAIAGLVEEGRPVKFSFNGLVLFDGLIDDIDVTHVGAKRFTADCSDLWGRLSSQNLSTPLYRGVRTGTAIGYVLDAVGWTGGRDLDPGATLIPWWWLEDVDAAAAIEDLVASEGPPATTYIENGTFCFRDRHARILDSASNTVQATFSHAVPAGSRPGTLKILKGATYDRQMAGIANTVSWLVEQRAPQERQVVWSTEDTYTLASGETIEIKVVPEDPFLDATTPVEGTDYTLRSGAVVVWLTRTSGQSVTIVVRASAPSVLAGMALRALPVPVARTVKVEAEDSQSVARRGRRAWQGEAKWANVEDARAIAQRIVATYAANRPTVTITIAYAPGMPGGSTYLTQIQNRRIGDRVRIILDSLGVDDEFWVERLEHEIVKLGALHKLTLGCQIAGADQPAAVFTFDVAGRGFNDGVFGISGIDDPDTVLTFDGGSGHRFNEGVFAT